MNAELPEVQDSEFDITPMIDIVFLLITFFMVVAAEITEKVEVELPEAEQAVVPEETRGRMEVSLQVDGQIWVSTVPVSEEEFIAVLNERRQDPGFRLFLRADERVEHFEVQRIMQLCADQGVPNIIFATLQGS